MARAISARRAAAFLSTSRIRTGSDDHHLLQSEPGVAGEVNEVSEEIDEFRSRSGKDRVGSELGRERGDRVLVASSDLLCILERDARRQAVRLAELRRRRSSRAPVGLEGLNMNAAAAAVTLWARSQHLDGPAPSRRRAEVASLGCSKPVKFEGGRPQASIRASPEDALDLRAGQLVVAASPPCPVIVSG